MVGGHVVPDQPDHLIITRATGDEPAFASDQPHPRTSRRSSRRQLLASKDSVRPRCWCDLGVLTHGAHPHLRDAGTAQGNLAEAVNIYGHLSQCLRDQLGVSPSPATQALYERLLGAT